MRAGLPHRLILCSFLALLAGVAALVGQTLPEPQDPLAIRWVPVTVERVAAEVEALKRGAIRSMPRSDFEARLRKARAMLAARVPQLVEARYRATLSDASLRGNARWRVRHSGAGAGVMPLGTLNLAILEPRFVDGEKREALLADFEGIGMGLLVHESGDHDVAFDWSARNVPGGEGLRFHLETPPCAVATLELDLPEDRTLSAEGTSISGPHPAEAPELRRWRITFSRRPTLELRIRRLVPKDDGSAPVIVRSLTTAQKLLPDAVEVEYAFEVEMPRRALSSLQLQCDPTVQPLDVVAPYLSRWEIREPTKPGEPRRIELTLSSPFVGGKIVIQGIAPLLGDPLLKETSAKTQRWSSPWMEILGSVPGPEHLTLLVHPDVVLESWQTGGFQLQEARTEPEGLLLRLEGGLLSSQEGALGRADNRPSARLRTRVAEFRTQQLTWWRVGPDRSLVTTRISYEISHGRLFRLDVALPPEHEVEGVQIQPAQRFSSEVRPIRGKSVLSLVLTTPLGPGDPKASALPTVILQLRGRPGLRPVQPFPDVMPLGTQSREGGLALDIEEQRYEGILSVPPPSPGPPREEGPWGKQFPEFYYPFKGDLPRGQITLVPLPPQLRARASTSVVLAPNRAAAETAVSVSAEVGIAASFEVHFSSPVLDRWEWRVNGLPATFERIPSRDVAAALAPLGGASPLGGISLLQAHVRGETRRLILPRPVGPRETVTLQGAGDLARHADGIGWDVPLVTLPGAARMEGEVTLHLAGAPLAEVHAIGLRETQTSSARGRSASAYRTYRYGPGAISLALQVPPVEIDPVAEVLVDRATLLTALRSDGTLLHHFRFTLGNWNAPTLPLRLPTTAQILAIQVDGAWLAHLARTREDDEGQTLNLPVPRTERPGEPVPRYFEILYTTPGSPTVFGAQLQSPVPGLPGTPSSFRRIWRLPLGIIPIRPEDYHTIPGSSDVAWRQDRKSRSSDLLRWPLAFDEWEDLQRQQLRTAAALESGPRGRLLAEVLENLVCDHPDEAATLVIDTTALEEVGVTAHTPLPALDRDGPPFWQVLGLAHVPCRVGPLLTSRRQADTWKTLFAPSETPPDVEEAVGQAVHRGHDLSGRFRRASEWSRQGSGDLTREDRRHHPATLPLPELDGSRAADWEPLAGVAIDHLTVVRPDALSGIGIALTLVPLLVFWGFRRRSADFRLFVLLGWLALSGFGVLWLPRSLEDLAWWPLLVGGALAFGWFLLSTRAAAVLEASSPGKTSPRRTLGLATVLSLGILIGIPLSHGAAPVAPGPTPILVVAAEGVTDSEVLVPVAFLRTLDQLSKPTAHLGLSPTILSAEYRGNAQETHVEFEAVFHLISFDDEPSTLSLGFSGIELQEDALLNGASAFLSHLPQGGGYVVRLERPGRHQLRLRFRVPIRAEGPEREARFVLPRVLQTRLTMQTLPPGAVGFRAMARQGAETSSAPGIRVDLGRILTPLSLRWRVEAASTPEIRLDEAYLWQLRPQGASLSAVLRYEVSRGALPFVEIDLPDGLELRAASLAGNPSGQSLSDVRVLGAEGRRRLRLEFQTPLTGVAHVLLDLLPRQPLSPLAVLTVPEPLRIRSTSAYLAYRTEGVEARPENLGRLRGPYRTDRDRATLLPLMELWQAARETLPQPTAVYALQRDPGGAPFLRLRLRLGTPGGSAAHDIHWVVGRRYAELTSTIRKPFLRDDGTFLEWEIPGNVRITRVAGPAGQDLVRRWVQAEGKVQAWLSPTPEPVEVVLRGWTPLQSGMGGDQFTLPNLSLAGAPADPIRVTLAPESELALDPIRVAGLASLERTPDGGLRYRVVEPNYQGMFRVRPATIPAQGRVLFALGTQNREVTLHATVEVKARQGELGAIPIRFRGWEGKLELREAPHVRLQREPRTSAGERSWVLDLEPGQTSVRFLFSGSISLDDVASGVHLPEILVPGVEQWETWVGMTGNELILLGPPLVIPSEAEKRAAWPLDWDRLGATSTLGRLFGDATSARITSRPRLPQGPSVRLIFLETFSAIADGARWTHEAMCWLYHEANTNAQVALPQGARLNGVSVDGLRVMPLETNSTHLVIPLPGAAGPRTLRLRWDYDPAQESLTQPRLDRPVFQGTPEGPTAWRVQVPAGFRASVSPSNHGELVAASQAALDAARAQAQLNLSGLVVEAARGTSPPSLAILQRRFYRFLRYAVAARMASPTEATPGPQKIPFDDWLPSLREQNLTMARTFKFEALRSEAERQARQTSGSSSGPSLESYELAGLTLNIPSGLRQEQRLLGGSPLRWLGPADAPAPQLTISLTTEGQDLRALAASILWLVVLGAIWGLARLPKVMLWVRAFWPEELLLVGLLGWQTYGPFWILEVLVLVAVGARVIGLARQLAAFRPGGPRSTTGQPLTNPPHA